MKSIIKFIIKLFTSVIKKNKYALKYLFTDALRAETIQFIDYGYGETYPHIEKVCQLAHRFQVDKQPILDIGAANGYTAQLFRKYMPNAFVYIFEPLSQNHQAIQKVVKQNGNMRLIPKALGDEVAEMKMHKTSRITSSSLLSISDNVESEYMKEAIKDSVEEVIQVSTLDEEMKEVASIGIMKIDVQGYEMKVLKGAVKTLVNTKILVVEVSNHQVYNDAPMYYDVDEFLRANNFVLFDNCLTFKEKGRLREWDAIYVNKNIL